MTPLALAVPVAAQDASEGVLPDVLTLERAIEIARAERQEIVAADALADAADQRPTIVSTLPDPMVMGTLEHLPLPDPMDADWNVMVRQDFPLSDVLGARARTAEAEARRLRADVDRVALDVDLEVATAFFEVLLARELVGLLDRQLALTAQLVAASEARYAAAMGSQTDVLRSQAEYARIEARRRALDHRIAGAEGMLVAELGLPAGARVPPLVADEDADVDASIAEYVDRARRERPELESAREAIARARSEVSVMQQMYFPMARVQLGGAYSMIHGGGVMALLGISVPIYWDRLEAGTEEARAMARMAEADLEAMQRMIEGQAAAAVGALRAARTRRDAMRDEVLPLAQQAVDAALAQYGAAQVQQVTVVEAMRALFSIEIETLEAEIAASMAAARLERAIGDAP